MVKRLLLAGMAACLITMPLSCAKKETPGKKFTGARDEVRLITLDPGHFHAALVQKAMYEQVSPVVQVYAPRGPDVENHLNQIEGFNNRTDNPTNWQENVYFGEDFLEKMLTDKRGNVVVISGNNRKKAEYIKACVEAGLNVLADKPMCIDGKGFQLLEEAFASAQKNGALLYDIMTERSEITTVLQKELVHNTDVFGELEKGTVDAPAVIKESVHHFFKYVAGNPIKRPGWYFDTSQQGEGIVDVTTHLVDLVMWGCFPDKAIDYRKDIEVKRGKRWPTLITRQEYKKVTQLDDFPDFLKTKLDERGVLPCYANGEISFTVKGIHARVSVTWNFQAPEGAKDTHYSMMKGSKAIVSIRQGKEQNYRPELYVEAAGSGRDELGRAMEKAIAGLQSKYPGIELKSEGNIWYVLIPDKYRVGHEAHFQQVTERYLKYLVDGKLPDWEVSNMRSKYYITTKALEIAGK
ncbi:MAG TPA: putative oxidoreductase C-terminal domain-containing protein [Sedimentisphaerales bacterium]|nr:putative oxidoreductase C-terminal domain-containing protein [Sedimentisphaerales bacterium]